MKEVFSLQSRFDQKEAAACSVEPVRFVVASVQVVGIVDGWQVAGRSRLPLLTRCSYFFLLVQKLFATSAARTFLCPDLQDGRDGFNPSFSS